MTPSIVEYSAGMNRIHQHDPPLPDLDAFDVLKALPAYYFTKSVVRGVNSQIFLSAFQGGNDVNGKFFINMKENDLLPAAMDMDKAKELWKVSEEMSGVKFEL